MTDQREEKQCSLKGSRCDLQYPECGKLCDEIDPSKMTSPDDDFDFDWLDDE